MLTEITLPDLPDGRAVPALPPTAQVSIIGANGAGKTRFMQDLIERCADKAYCLSALSAFYPEREPSRRNGSIDMLYEAAVKSKPYLSTQAMSELDKLGHLLIADEFEELVRMKASSRRGVRLSGNRATKLDRVVELWERIFPDNHIMSEAGALLFANNCDEGTITSSRLSQGEKAVFYYIAAVLYAMPDAVIFIDSPSLFLHPAMQANLWNAIEEMRPDCRFVYNTVDIDFVSSRTANACIWVKSFDARLHRWDYEVLDNPSLSDELFLDIIGTRKPVLFIEGDSTHSIDGKLYPLVFTEYTVKPLGSCNKVIESTRSFNDLKYMHHLDSHGIVDRDRRTPAEVGYLRNKQIFVPEVAEVENIFLLEDVVRIMSRRRGRDPQRVAAKVRKSVMEMFRRHFDEQALQHVRHRVKREVECKVDARFTCITAMETHLRGLVDKLRPREHYNRLRSEFRNMITNDDYEGVLRVFNHKPMLSDSNLAQMLGFKRKEDYIAGVISALKGNGKDAATLRDAIKRCFGLNSDESYLPGLIPAADPGHGKKDQTATSPEQPPTTRRHKKKHSCKSRKLRNCNRRGPVK